MQCRRLWRMVTLLRESRKDLMNPQAQGELLWSPSAIGGTERLSRSSVQSPHTSCSLRVAALGASGSTCLPLDRRDMMKCQASAKQWRWASKWDQRRDSHNCCEDRTDPSH